MNLNRLGLYRVAPGCSDQSLRVAAGALEHRRAILAARILAGLLGAAQARLGLAVRILHLAPVLNVREAGFYILKLGGIHHVLIARGQDFRNFLLCLRGPRRGGWVAVEGLIEEPGLLLLHGLQLLEESGE